MSFDFSIITKYILIVFWYFVILFFALKLGRKSKIIITTLFLIFFAMAAGGTFQFAAFQIFIIFSFLTAVIMLFNTKKKIVKYSLMFILITHFTLFALCSKAAYGLSGSLIEERIETFCKFAVKYQNMSRNNLIRYSPLEEKPAMNELLHTYIITNDSYRTINTYNYNTQEFTTDDKYLYYMFPKYFVKPPLKSIINHPAYKLENGVLYMKNVHDKEEVFTSENWKVITDYNELRKKE